MTLRKQYDHPISLETRLNNIPTMEGFNGSRKARPVTQTEHNPDEKAEESIRKQVKAAFDAYSDNELVQCCMQDTGVSAAQAVKYHLEQRSLFPELKDTTYNDRSEKIDELIAGLPKRLLYKKGVQHDIETMPWQDAKDFAAVTATAAGYATALGTSYLAGNPVENVDVALGATPGIAATEILQSQKAQRRALINEAYQATREVEAKLNDWL